MEDNQNPIPTPTPVVSDTPNPVPPATNPIKPASKFSIKAIIGIIVFLLLAGGAAASYVYREPIMKLVAQPTPSPTEVSTKVGTPDPTADWKTFTSTDNIFSLKYPGDFWTNLNNNPNSIKSWAFNNPCYDFEHPCPTPPVSNYQIFIEEIPNKDNLQLTEYIKKQKADWGKDADLYDVAISSPIEGHEAAAGNVQSLAGPWWLLTLIKDDNQIISIKCVSCEKDFNNQILSTFKFTVSKNADTSNWKTFSTTNFSFNYPSDKFKIEEREKEYFALVPVGEISGYAGIFIDTRKSNYDDVMADIKGQLIKPTITNIPNGEIVSGVIGSPKTEGMSLEGTSVKAAIIRNRNRSAYIATMGTQTKDNSFTLFESIVSTFKFTN